jgi:DNA-binding NtrC family response regulator
MDSYNHPDSAERPSKNHNFKAILVVDDDKQLVQLLQWILADQNFLVDKAYNGHEALLKVKANEYDAVICDMIMPCLTGDQFYYRAIEARPDIAQKFVFITAHAHDRKTYLFFAHNCVRFLEKPFSIQKLITAVNEVLAGIPPPEAMETIRVTSKKRI